MSTKRPTDPASDSPAARVCGSATTGPARRVARDVTRREFIGTGGTLAALAGAGWLAASWPRAARAETLPTDLLEKSGFVYISPLRADGRESTCHGEVWYVWIDGAVAIVTSADTWKARARAKGLDRARVWVGDHGRVRGTLGRNEDFRAAPSFDARVGISTDASLLDRMLARYREKYPDEIARWEPRYRAGFADGTRAILLYEPAPR